MLSEEQKIFYKENGYIILSNIFTELEIEECSKEYDFLFERKRENSLLEATWEGDWEKGDSGESKKKTSVLSIHNLQCHSSIFARMLFNKKLIDAISELIDSENILLHHTKAHIKPPSIGSKFPMHQDYYYFPYKNDSMVAAFISLDESDPENGGLAIFPGSHKFGPLPSFSNSNKFFFVNQSEYPIEKATPILSKKGDIIVFSYLLIHGSFPNTSNRIRRMLLLQIMSADDEPIKKVHKSPCQGLVLKGRNLNKNADLDKRHE